MKRIKARYIVGLLFLAAVGGLIWFSRITYTADRCIGDVFSLEEILRAYGRDHEGNLPSGPDDLVTGGYVEINDNGVWVSIGNDIQGDVYWPEEFDIAWGLQANDVDEEGRVIATGRWIIKRADPSRCSDGFCGSLSARLAESLWQYHAAATDSAP